MIKLLFLGLIRTYQFIQPLMLPIPSCRFTPTCSEYTFNAIEKYGIIKGIHLGIEQILKCHPFHKGNYDPLG